MKSEKVYKINYEKALKYVDIKIIKKAIYKYMKALNKIESKKYNWKKSTLKTNNVLEFKFVSNLNLNNIKNIINSATWENIKVFY
nr:MAG TPA: hypothetical protein [Bacteriophage sp.]